MAGIGLSFFDPTLFNVAALPALVAVDNAESYSDTDPINGLNGGAGWNGAWVARAPFAGLVASDDAESYSDTDGVDGLNGGTGWNGAWVSR